MTAAAEAGVAAGQQGSGGILIHGATGGGSKDTLDPHAPVTNPGHRAGEQPLRAAAVLEQQLRARAGARRVRRVVARRHEVDRQDAPGRDLPQRQGRHRRGRVVQHPARRRPEGAALRGRSALPDPRLRVHEGGRRDHARAGAEGALRDPRRAAGGVHRRHHPDRLRHREPRGHRRLRLQVLRPRQDQHLHQVRRLLGRRGVRRRAADPGLPRRQRHGQRSAGRPDPDGRQPALQPHRHHQGGRRRRRWSPRPAPGCRSPCASTRRRSTTSRCARRCA